MRDKFRSFITLRCWLRSARRVPKIP